MAQVMKDTQVQLYFTNPGWLVKGLTVSPPAVCRGVSPVFSIAVRDESPYSVIRAKAESFLLTFSCLFFAARRVVRRKFETIRPGGCRHCRTFAGRLRRVLRL